MTTEMKRFSLSATLFAAIAAAALTIAPSNAQASPSEALPVRIMDTCPNPAPSWCNTGGEGDRCPDGDLDWRGCKEKPIE